jgi:hypothetical protein
VTVSFSNSAQSFENVSDGGKANKKFQKVSEDRGIVRFAANNTRHQAMKIPVVEHKGSGHICGASELKIYIVNHFRRAHSRWFRAHLCPHLSLSHTGHPQTYRVGTYGTEAEGSQPRVAIRHRP